MGKNIIEFTPENDGSPGSVGLTHSAASQKIHLKWTSVWGGKCLKFFEKMKDFGGLWG